jgi:phosphate transport system permease protein
MTDTSEHYDRLVAKRYAEERRFRGLGLGALILTTVFLAFLLYDIISRSIPAYTQHEANLTLVVDASRVDAKDPAKGDFEGLIKDAWRAQFPTIQARADRRLIGTLLSNGAADELRRRVVADPSLVGKEITVPALLSDDADIHFKGLATASVRSAGKGQLSLRQEGENFFLQGDGLQPGSIVFAHDGALRVKSGGTSEAAEVFVTPGKATPTDSWTLLTFTTPEAERKLNDKESTWLEMVRDKGNIERSLARNFFFNGDSREAELSGILGSVAGSLMVVFITVLLALPLGVAAAIYLEQFAPKNRWTQLIEVNINNLAAVPSIIFGLLGLAVFLGFFGMPRSIPLVGGLVIALMSLPTIIIASRAALRAVPPSIKEAALGVGASHQQAVFHHVLPLAMPGIMTGTILAVASAIGETAPLLLIGMVAFIVDVPQGFFESATVLPVQIYLWSDLPEKAFEARTAAAIVALLVVMMLLNAFAIYLRKRFERRW